MVVLGVLGVVVNKLRKKRHAGEVAHPAPPSAEPINHNGKKNGRRDSHESSPQQLRRGVITEDEIKAIE